MIYHYDENGDYFDCYPLCDPDLPDEKFKLTTENDQKNCASICSEDENQLINGYSDEKPSSLDACQIINQEFCVLEYQQLSDGIQTKHPLEVHQVSHLCKINYIFQKNAKTYFFRKFLQ